MKRHKRLISAALLVVLFLIPYKVHKHLVPGKSFADVPGLPAPLSPYDSLIRAYADSIDWDWRLVAAIICQESRFNSQVISPGGAVGLMQIQSAQYSQETLLNPEQNIRIGTQYLRKLEQMFPAASAQDTLQFTLSAYNMGERKLQQLRDDAQACGKNAGRWEEVLPQWHATRRYVNNILRRYELYRVTQPSAARLRVLSDTIPTN